MEDEMQKWEYMYIEAYRNDVRSINEKSNPQGKDSLPRILKQCGDEGWELVGVRNVGESSCWSFIFKRPKE
jgi:hypothetical protein